MQGSYYHLAKRLLGIEYVKRVEEDEDEAWAEQNTRPVFRVLGGVAALHLALSILQTLRKPPSNPFSTASATSPPLSSSNETRTNGQRCPLCLDSLGTRGVSETNSLKLNHLRPNKGKLACMQIILSSSCMMSAMFFCDHGIKLLLILHTWQNRIFFINNRKYYTIF